jgi:hypothetical protein
VALKPKVVAFNLTSTDVPDDGGTVAAPAGFVPR